MREVANILGSGYLYATEGFDDGEIYIKHKQDIIMAVNTISRQYLVRYDIAKPKNYIFVKTPEGQFCSKIKQLLELCVIEALNQIQKGDYNINTYHLENLRETCVSYSENLEIRYKELVKLRKPFIKDLNMLCKHLSENGYSKIRNKPTTQMLKYLNGKHS